MDLRPCHCRPELPTCRTRSIRWACGAAVAVLVWGGQPALAGPLDGEEIDAGGWRALSFLVGTWDGHEEGVAGAGRGRRTYETIIDGTFLLARNRSVFEPQERNPEGEVHEDWQIFSYDRSLETIVLRQFHSEGFVHRYHHEPGDAADEWVFVSREIENAPPGVVARLVLRRTGADSFEEVYSLVFPGEEPRELLRIHWQRRVAEESSP